MATDEQGFLDAGPPPSMRLDLAFESAGVRSSGNLVLDQFDISTSLPVLYLPTELESFVAAVQVNGSPGLALDSELVVDDPGPWASFGRWRRNNLSYTSIDLFRVSAARLTRVWWRVSGRFLRLSDAISSSQLFSLTTASADDDQNAALTPADVDQRQERSSTDTSTAPFGDLARTIDAFAPGTLLGFVKSNPPLHADNVYARATGWTNRSRSTAPAGALFAASPDASSILPAAIAAVTTPLIAPDADIAFAQPAPLDLTPVPEPATWTGLALLGAALAWWRLRQRRDGRHA